jgi:glyoxylase-like metal-dependent hydrolase (beta-lactamase superfamily II)
MASAPATDDVFRIDSIASGVWVAEVIARPEAYAFANSLIVAGADGLLVVDTQQSPAAAGALVRWIAERFDRPVRWVVNTHFHGDHVNGNATYRAVWPDVEVVAHASVVEAISTDGRARIDEELASLPATIEQRQGWLDSGTGPDGSTLTDAQRDALTYSVRVNRTYVDDLAVLAADLDAILPDRAMDAPTTLDLGDRTVRLIPVGPAHTEGDLAVWVDDVRVAAVGDLLEEAAPWIDGADLHGWSEALAAVRALSPEHVVASHGSATAGPRLLEGEAALFADLVAAAEDAGGAAPEVVGSAAAESAGGGDAGGVDDASVAAVAAALESHHAFLESLGLSGEALAEWVEAAARQALAEVQAR